MNAITDIFNYIFRFLAIEILLLGLWGNYYLGSKIVKIAKGDLIAVERSAIDALEEQESVQGRRKSRD